MSTWASPDAAAGGATLIFDVELMGIENDADDYVDPDEEL
jgi:hypothetical protein